MTLGQVLLFELDTMPGRRATTRQLAAAAGRSVAVTQVALEALSRAGYITKAFSADGLERIWTAAAPLPAHNGPL